MKSVYIVITITNTKMTISTDFQKSPGYSFQQKGARDNKEQDQCDKRDRRKARITDRKTELEEGRTPVK